MNNDANSFVAYPLEEPCSFIELHRHNPKRYPFLLESTAKAATVNEAIASEHARYSVLFAFPQDSITLFGSGEIKSERYKIIKNDFLDTFSSAWQAEASQNNITSQDANTSFLGWFVFAAYELVQFIEPTLKLELDSSAVIARATRIPFAIVCDMDANTNTIVCENVFTEKISKVLDDISMVAKHNRAKQNLTNELKTEHFRVNLNEEDESEFLDGVHKIKRYIYDGDIFQVNYSRQWQGTLKDGASAVDLYTSLKNHNPAPFSALVHYDEFDIICSSPERLVKTHNKNIETRPIAGTRPRVSNDVDMLNELLSHPKERAEHIMLIDLERNDLGRVCKPGSVEVTELMSLESFAHVHHIVSNIAGKLNKTVLPGDIIRAVFPGGTITGCPKVRCMEIISELEKTPRGAYTGSLGYIGHNGNMDLNILIRTLVKQGKHISLRAGAGIVADSNAELELEETRAKAKGILLSLVDIHD